MFSKSHKKCPLQLQMPAKTHCLEIFNYHQPLLLFSSLHYSRETSKKFFKQGTQLTNKT